MVIIAPIALLALEWSNLGQIGPTYVLNIEKICFNALESETSSLKCL